MVMSELGFESIACDSGVSITIFMELGASFVLFFEYNKMSYVLSGRLASES